MLPALSFRRITFDWSRTYVVGILNVTPDSFSDGGAYADADAAIARGRELAAAGADVIDIGGESTRPVGARAVGAAEELSRVVPVIEALRELSAAISIDTTKADVARRAVAAGAEIVNDISGGNFDHDMVAAVAATGAAFVLGHARGASLADVHAAEREPPGLLDVIDELAARLDVLPATVRGQTIVDPGLGFGKRTPQNLELMKGASRISDALQCPVMLGPSRKRFLGELTGLATGDRDDATVGAALAGAASGAHFVRVHDVARLRPALTVFEAVRGAGREPEAAG